jgi:hypothetical protein
MRDRRHPGLVRVAVAVALLALVALGAGCKKGVTCATELKDGEATFRGSAKGEKEDGSLRDNAMRDACRQLCAAKPAELVDACASTCVTDVTAAKLGAKTTCE